MKSSRIVCGNDFENGLICDISEHGFQNTGGKWTRFQKAEPVTYDILLLQK